MAMFDTHRAVKTLTGAGFSETQAEALIDAIGEGHEDLATKADLKEHIAAARADMKEQFASVRVDMQALELRLTLRLGALVVAAAVLLAVLELIP